MNNRYHATSIDFTDLSVLLCSDSSIFDDKPIGYTINTNLIGTSLRRVSANGFFTSTPYDIGENNYVISESFEPKACKAWCYVDVEAYVPSGTSLNYRLSLDGVIHYVWDGDVWVVAGEDDWNTLAEIREGISHWQYSDDIGGPDDKRLRFVVNLVSDDGSRTPVIRRILVVWEIQESYNTFEDMVFDTLIPRLESLTVIKEWATDLIVVPDDSEDEEEDHIIISSTDNYDVVSIDSVYDHTDDEEHKINIFDHYDALTRTVYFKNNVSKDNLIWISFNYHPKVHIMTSTDYDIVEPPAIIIESIKPIMRYENTRKTIVKTGTSANALVFPISSQVSFNFRCSLMFGKVRDIARIRSVIGKNFKAIPYLNSEYLDERWDLRYLDNCDGPETSSLSEIAEGTVSFDILHVPQWDVEATEGFVVTQEFRPGLYRREE